MAGPIIRGSFNYGRGYLFFAYKRIDLRLTPLIIKKKKAEPGNAGRKSIVMSSVTLAFQTKFVLNQGS